ncbi:MAG: alpha/beta fold hydrolase [Gemmatimonadota bacterium]
MQSIAAILILLTVFAFGAACAQDDGPPPNRTPIDDAGFAAIADFYAYDRDLPLRAEVLSTQTHDGRQLPYRTDKVRFRTINGHEVVGYFAYAPEDGVPPRPAVILLHGNNRYRGSHDTWTTRWLDILAREGYCVLAIDQYGFGERFVTGKAPNFSGEMGPYERRDALRQHVVDARRAIDYVGSRPEVDTTRVVLMGESMGGYNACLAAGLEDRLRGVVMVVTGAWGRDTHDSMGRLFHTLNFAPRISAPALMVYSTQDGRDVGQELFDHLPEPKEIVWHEIDDHVILVDNQRPAVVIWLARQLR